MFILASSYGITFLCCSGVLYAWQSTQNHLLEDVFIHLIHLQRGFWLIFWNFWLPDYFFCCCIFFLRVCPLVIGKNVFVQSYFSKPALFVFWWLEIDDEAYEQFYHWTKQIFLPFTASNFLPIWDQLRRCYLNDANKFTYPSFRVRSYCFLSIFWCERLSLL